MTNARRVPVERQLTDFVTRSIAWSVHIPFMDARDLHAFKVAVRVRIPLGVPLWGILMR